jgi:uncharacterized protein YndB with AHSA1/START domain
MNVQLTVKQRIKRPIAEVFDAVVDPAKLSSYFVTSTTGPLVAGQTVKWTWGEISDDTIVDEVIENKLIVCRWNAYKIDYHTTCRFEFTSNDDGSTTVTVHESGWRSDQDGIDSALEHAGGWQHMLLCLKAWIEHGIDLRK